MRTVPLFSASITIHLREDEYGSDNDSKQRDKCINRLMDTMCRFD